MPGSARAVGLHSGCIVEDDGRVAAVSALYGVLRDKRAIRRNYIGSLVNLFKVTPCMRIRRVSLQAQKSDSPGPLLIFVAENLAALPYTMAEEALFVIDAIKRTVAVSGDVLWKASVTHDLRPADVGCRSCETCCTTPCRPTRRTTSSQATMSPPWPVCTCNMQRRRQLTQGASPKPLLPSWSRCAVSRRCNAAAARQLDDRVQFLVLLVALRGYLKHAWGFSESFGTLDMVAAPTSAQACRCVLRCGRQQGQRCQAVQARRVAVGLRRAAGGPGKCTDARTDCAAMVSGALFRPFRAIVTAMQAKRFLDPEKAAEFFNKEDAEYIMTMRDLGVAAGTADELATPARQACERQQRDVLIVGRHP